MTRSKQLFHGLLIVLALTLPNAALAHGPTPQKAEETIHIDAAPAEVWKIVGDVSAFADWQPQLSAVRASEGNDEIADTVGAGDTFNAGMLASLHRADLLHKDAIASLSGDAVHDALLWGAKAAAVTVSRPGANPPWAEEIEF